ncbi:hypothetical protein C8F01DRAFT_1146042 [Mycena amicta]|nr:hypothetical protein C8F01DRAFT_1146042 [Mycena amicta]
MPPSHQIYANQLGPLQHGFPLWIPEPSDGKEVRAGIASCPESERVPSGFSALRLPGPWGDDSLDEDTVAQLIPPGTVRSESVRETKIGFSADTGPSLPGNAAVTYSCSRQQGAHTVALGTFEEYILKNHTSWLDFAKSRGRRIKETDLILVTGVVKTYGWSAASFHESNSSISFHIKSFAGGPAVGLSFSGEWEQHTSVAKRCYTEPPEGEQPRANQAIFLKGFKMKQRKFPLKSLVPEELKAEAEPYGRAGRAMEIDTQYAISETYHPSDALLDYILQHSDAEVAIVHDDHWCGRTKHPLIPDDVDVAELVREYAESLFARQSAEHSFDDDDSDSDLDAMNTDSDSDLQSTGTSALADPAQFSVAGTSMLLDPPPVAPAPRSKSVQDARRSENDSDLGAMNTDSDLQATGTSALQMHLADVAQLSSVADTLSKSMQDARRSANDSGSDCPSCGSKNDGRWQWRVGVVSQMMVCSPCGSYESRKGKLRPRELEQRRASRRRSP